MIWGEFNLWWLRKRNLDDNEPLRWAETHAYSVWEVRSVRKHPASDNMSIKPIKLNRGDSRMTDSVLLIPNNHEVPHS